MNSNTNTTSTANNNNNTTSNNNHQNGESNEAKKVCSITVRMNGRIFGFFSQARIEKSPPSRVGEFEKKNLSSARTEKNSSSSFEKYRC